MCFQWISLLPPDLLSWNWERILRPSGRIKHPWRRRENQRHFNSSARAGSTPPSRHPLDDVAVRRNAVCDWRGLRAEVESMTDLERKVIDILVGCGVVHDCFNRPIHEVGNKMGWPQGDARLFVKDLVARKLARSVAGVGHGRIAAPPSCHWEEIKEESPREAPEQTREPTL